MGIYRTNIIAHEPGTIQSLRNANPKEIKASVQKVVESCYRVETRRYNNNSNHNPLRKRNTLTGKSI